MTLRVDCVTELTDVDRLAREWDGVLARSASCSAFLSWDWVSAWWDVYHQRSRLHVLTVRNEAQRLLGFAPLKTVRRGGPGPFGYDVIEFLGAGGDVTPEYLDFIAERGHEREVTKALIGALRADSRWAAVDLKPMAGDSLCLPIIQEVLGEGGEKHHWAEYSVCPVLRLPDRWESFLAGRSVNYRKKIGEYIRRARRDLNAQVVRCRSPEAVAEDLAKLAALHHSRWRGESKSFLSSSYLEFHKRLALIWLNKDRLRLYFLVAEGKRVAALYCFRDDETVYYYQSGRDPRYARYRVGNILLHEAIREAIQDGAKVFDFLTGDEAYKYRWADTRRVNLRLLWWRHSVPRVLEQGPTAMLKTVFRRFLSPAGGKPGLDLGASPAPSSERKAGTSATAS